MPRERVHPQSNETWSEPQDGAPPSLPLLPTVEVGWQRDHCSVQIGLETPTHYVPAAASTGQDTLVNHLYATQAEAIGDALIAQLHLAGWKIGDDPEAEQGVSFPATNETLGRMVMDALTGAVEGYPGGRGWTGWYTHLNHRSEVNRLITLLRRARDAAFGKDA